MLAFLAEWRAGTWHTTSIYSSRRLHVYHIYPEKSFSDGIYGYAGLWSMHHVFKWEVKPKETRSRQVIITKVLSTTGWAWECLKGQRSTDQRCAWWLLLYLAFCGNECNIDQASNWFFPIIRGGWKDFFFFKKKRKKGGKWHIIGDYLVVELTAINQP